MSEAIKNKNTRFSSSRGFTLMGTLAICVILMAVSGALLMRTTQTRLSMRTAAVANQYQMSMDNMLRTFGTLASEMAVVGGDGRVGGSALAAFNDTATMSNGIRGVLPAEWTNNPGIVTTDISVNSWAGGGAANVVTMPNAPNLMNSSATWRTLNTRALRSNILPPNQSFAGRSWGYRAQISVDVADNLDGIQTSWGKDGDTGQDSITTHGGRSIYTNSAGALMVITEIPSQFSVQGQNLQLRANAGQRVNIGTASSNSSTILGRTVDMQSALHGSVSRTTKVVARGGITGKGAWASNAISDARTRLASEAIAGAGAETDLEEAGSAVLVNVGTRGKEIFCAPEDYVSMITDLSRGERAGEVQVSDFLKYWLPYYQCNFKITFTVDPGNIRHSGSGAGGPGHQYTVSDVYFTRMNDLNIPSRRTNTISLRNLHSGFAGLSTNATSQGRVGLVNFSNKRPFSYVMRSLRPAVGVSSSNWVNTIDVDLEAFFNILTNPVTIGRLGSASGLSINPAQWNTMPVALHIDIKQSGSGSSFFRNAETVPVVIRRAGLIPRPFSIVTPGTVHIPGDFGTILPPGATRQMPFSIFAPKVKFGMDGRQPRTTTVRGQRVGVGSGTNRQSSVLDVVGGNNQLAGSATNRLSNINIGTNSSAGAALPPVFLKDWLIETYSDF